MKFAELCAGSAALTLHLHGSKPPMPYMGSKARYAHAIAELYGLTKPDEVLLVDPGPWGEAWQCLLSPTVRPALIARVEALVKEDPRQLFDRLRKESVHNLSMVERTARFLVLQRLAFSGKGLSVRPDGTWIDPGFQETAAYGRAGTERFGEVKPLLPKLSAKLGQLPLVESLRARACSALEIEPPYDASDWVVYIDPPYRGTTGYGPDDLTRDDVVRIARRWDNAGAVVIVSEAEPIDLPWHTVEITDLRRGKKSSWQRREWLTSNRPAAQLTMLEAS